MPRLGVRDANLENRLGAIGESSGRDPGASGIDVERALHVQ